MQTQTKETRIVLAIETIHTTNAAQMYEVFESTIRNRMKGYLPKAEKRNAQHILTESEEETLVRYVLDLDS